jgi:hypothetical protein
MKNHLRKIEAGRSGGYGHYNFTVTFPSGKIKTLSNIANAPLFDSVKDLETGIVSVSHSVWKTIRYYLN